jgi:hypothetical protein
MSSSGFASVRITLSMDGTEDKSRSEQFDLALNWCKLIVPKKEKLEF